MDTMLPAGLVDLNRFGIPERIFGPAVSQDLVDAIGLVAMLGALAEHRIESLWIELTGRSASDKGPASSPSVNIDRCKKILAATDEQAAEEDDGPEGRYRKRAVDVLDRAEGIFEKRNKAVHTVWSVPHGPHPGGYKSPPPKKRGDHKLERPYDSSEGQLEDMRRTITELVVLIERLGDLIGSIPSGVHED